MRCCLFAVALTVASLALAASPTATSAVHARAAFAQIVPATDREVSFVVDGTGPQILTRVDHLLHPAGTPASDPILAPAPVAALRAFGRPWATGGQP